MISNEDAADAGLPVGVVPVQMSYETSARIPLDCDSYSHCQAVGADFRLESYEREPSSAST